jgi:beta-hydroxylase
MKWVVVALFLSSVTWVHFRGRTRHRFWRQLFDHSALMAPINVFLYATSRVPARPFLPMEDFPELKQITANWRDIRDEAVALRELQAIKAAEKNNDAGFNSFFKYGWKRFYLKWYGEELASASRLCPRTVELLSRIPNVKAAMFAELPSGGKLNPHRDPYAGSLRYHLGLETPNDDRCFIEVDGERYSWRDGEAVMFDETFIHHARNGADRNRLILFCDIERPLRFAWARACNRWFARHVMTAATSPNDAEDRTGLINRLFIMVWHAGRLRRRFKAWNRAVYRLTKFALIAGVLAFIFLA